MPAKQRSLIWSLSDDPAYAGYNDNFRAQAELAAAAGATHINITRIPPSRWQMVDPRDPHPEWTSWPIWSMALSGMFKLAVPEALAEWLPRAEAERNLDLLAERCDILRSLGLRAAYAGNDPMWLPEGVFRAHPEWRGAQGELLCIARLSYFSPCVDHPEVLEMYRWAMEQLCRRVPELDYWASFTNDSAGGLCWSGSYPGDNGPAWCHERSHTERVVGFLSALQQGARDAGCEVEADLRVCSVPPAFDYHQLRPGQLYNGRNQEGRPVGSGVGSNSYWGNHMYPVLGLPRMFSFAEELEGALAADTVTVSIGFGPLVEDALIPLYRELVAAPTRGPAARTAALRRVAATLVAEEHAEQLVEVWTLIERSVECARHVRGYGYASIALVGAGMMRWLTMPLVPDPSRLTPEEKAFYQRHRVVTNEIEADSYHAILGRPGVIGSSAVWMAQNSFNEAIAYARRAASGMRGLVASAGDEGAAALLRAWGDRAQTLACVYTTCRNFIQYEEALAQRSPEEVEVIWRDQTGTYGLSRAGVELRAIARSELDNAYELAALLEQATAPILPLAATPEGEDSFVFSPDLTAQLRRKAELMLDHWAEYNEDYPAQPQVQARQVTEQGDVRPGLADNWSDF
ncbi:MAG TPA: hypothetical protein VGM19_01110 [Armatimonadota bacterium]|jgi:hypothetical protein